MHNERVRASARASGAPARPAAPGGGGPRTAVITGGNAGLGFECAKQMLAAGWRIVLACRNPTKAATAVATLGELTGKPDAIEAMVLDVSSLASVNDFAKAYLSDETRKLHVLICNATRGSRWTCRS